MDTTYTPKQSSRRRSSADSALLQTLIALVGGMALFFILLLGALTFFDMSAVGRVYPGVSVAGIDLSGLSLEEATAALTEQVTFPENGKIVFQDGERTWIARPSELGLAFDTVTSASAAYNLGRERHPITRLFSRLGAWYSGRDLPPLMIYDERVAMQYLEGIATRVNQPTIDASLTVSGTNVIVSPGQIGRTLDTQAVLAELQPQMQTLTDGLLPLIIHESPPIILDASQQAAIARQILSAPLTLIVPSAQSGDPGPWTFPPDQLAGMLKIERVDTEAGATYQVGLDAEQLRTFLNDLIPQLARNPANARFIFNEETRQLEPIQPSVIGRSLDIEATLHAINEKMTLGAHEVELTMIFTQPEVSDTATAQQLGISGLVSQQTTYFYGSDGSRIQNIQTAAGQFHGVLVPPGATFSMADILGDVSLDTGYSEALIIYGNRTIKGVGGGVCQVSTTLFRTVFFGGYPVVERNPHAYRVYYYELNAANQVNTNMAGLDAAVFVPVVDFKFKNDSSAWLLMETYVNSPGRTLTWKVYSTPDGREVRWHSSGLQNLVDPDEPLYQENPELDEGEIRQVDWEVAGADVSIERIVMRDGQVYLQDNFSTHYLPWRAVYEYGPGTKINKLKKRR